MENKGGSSLKRGWPLDVAYRGVPNGKPPFERALYRERNQIGRLIGRLERCRRIGTRYDQTARNYLSFVHVVSTLIMPTSVNAA